VEQALGGFIHTEIAGLVGLVFTLGLRHGFDPDHLVAIDGMTRSSKSRWCGLFFSLGHGAVVTLVAAVVAIAAQDWQPPPWFEQTGAAISIGVLLVLGIANLASLWRAPAGAMVPLVGLRGRWLTERAARASHPALIVSVGAAFALSFDTLSHALLFSFTGWMFAAFLGLAFTLGMVVTDALNGWWVAKMMADADRRAAFAARLISVVVAFLCLGIAALALAKHALPAVDELAARVSPVVSAATLVLIASVFAAAVLRSRSACRETSS
jgi:high-affinity nickel-transport protein